MAAKKKTVLLFDLLHTGHHLNYISLFVQAFREKGWHVIFASSPDTFTSEEYQQLLRCQEGQFQPLPVHAKSQTCRNRWLRFFYQILELHQAVNQTRSDVVFFPYLDRYYKALCLYDIVTRLAGYKRRKYHGIFFTGAFAYKDLPQKLEYRIKEWLVKLFLWIGTCRRVLFLDRVVYQYFSYGIRTRTIIGVCPDPVENIISCDREKFRHDIGIPAGAKVLGVFGSMRKSKGCDLLLRAFADYGPKENEYLLVLGKHEIEMKAVMDELKSRSKINNIISVDRFLGQKEFLAGLQIADVICVPIPVSYASSSILIHSAALGKPALTSNSGWVGRMVRQYGLGLACDVCDSARFVEGIRWAFEMPSLDRKQATAFAEMNTPERFKEMVVRNINLSRRG